MKKTFLILTMISCLFMAPSCIGKKKSKCNDCPGFTLKSTEAGDIS